MISWLTSTYAGKILSTFLISMMPVVELRGALPIGVGMGLDPLTSLIVSILGNMVPVPFVILFIRKVFSWMRRFDRFERIVDRMEEKARKHESTILKYEMMGLFILVAIPLPGTGAWTGSLVAALFDLQIRRAFLIIFAGVVAAGIIVFILTYGFVSIF